MKKINNDFSKTPDYDDVIIETEDDEFEIGQGCEGIPDKKIICKKCGSDRWIVGVGSHHTSIKCPKCLWELCIHDG